MVILNVLLLTLVNTLGFQANIWYTNIKLSTGQTAVTGIPKSCADLRYIGHSLNGFYSVMGSTEMHQNKTPWPTEAHRELARTNDEKRKAAAQTYADSTRHTKPSFLAIGDSVLLRQQKSENKTLPFYNPNPYIIANKTGSMVTAKHNNSTITRILSFALFYAAIHSWLLGLTIHPGRLSILLLRPMLYLHLSVWGPRRNHYHQRPPGRPGLGLSLKPFTKMVRMSLISLMTMIDPAEETDQLRHNQRTRKAPSRLQSAVWPLGRAQKIIGEE